MAGEVIAFSGTFDILSTLSAELKTLAEHRVPFRLLTDIKCLFCVMSKGSRMSEGQMTLDIAAAHQGFRDCTISDIGFAWSPDNIADGLKKHVR